MRLDAIVGELTAQGYKFLDCIGTPLPEARIITSPNALLRIVCV